ncbi:hypothetical protein CASFOL_008617 [Castilleja foliolosa]|uniref:Uncharacterized protein n=1 Tax=Castilleja foliolosa TaxID=1961234 RepID=A0ABD3E3M2_9LAMI
MVGKKPIGTNPYDEEEVSLEEGILITKAPDSSNSNSGDDDGDPNGPSIVDQESLEALKEIKSPAVFCVAASFGSVRLIDNMEINVR